VRAEDQAEALRRAGPGMADAELLRACRGTIARCEAIDLALESLALESGGFEQARSRNRSRHRLRSAASALWLEVDRVS